MSNFFNNEEIAVYESYWEIINKNPFVKIAIVNNFRKLILEDYCDVTDFLSIVSKSKFIKSSLNNEFEQKLFNPAFSLSKNNLEIVSRTLLEMLKSKNKNNKIKDDIIGEEHQAFNSEILTDIQTSSYGFLKDFERNDILNIILFLFFSFEPKFHPQILNIIVFSFQKLTGIEIKILGLSKTLDVLENKDIQEAITQFLSEKNSCSEGFFLLKTNTEINIISSVSSFINSLKEFSSKKIFFRGQENCNYLLQPSIFRENGWMLNEGEMYRNIICECPDEFTSFKYESEKLVKMQHYGMPTRLLDITKNPLVALYFACNSKSDNNAEVIVFSIDKFKYSGDFEVEQIARIPLIKGSLCEIISEYHIKFLTLLETIKFFSSSSNSVNDIDKLHFQFNYEMEGIKNLANQFSKNRILIYFQNLDYYASDFFDFAFFYEKINEIGNKEVSLSAEEILDLLVKTEFKIDEILEKIENGEIYYDFSKCINNQVDECEMFMPVKQNNRLIRQSGAFILMNRNSVDKINRYRLIHENKKIITIIPSSKKADILIELETLNINHASLFPDIDQVAKHIKEKYSTNN